MENKTGSTPGQDAVSAIISPETGGTFEQKPLKPYIRQAGNWLNAYLEFTEASESPESYHMWAALSAIASAVRRNVWVDQGLYVLYPNLYVAFVGPPGRTAKSTALWLCRQILHQVGAVRMGPEACSREQLIRELAEAKFDNQCALTIHCSEFSDLVDTSGILMIQFLTSIYDGNYVGGGGWKYSTKHQGKDVVVNPFLNIIFGTTPSYLADSMPDSIVGHGFTARTIVVHEEKERHTNALPDAKIMEIEKALVSDLKHISNLRGQFKWGGEITDVLSRSGRKLTEAEVAYKDFYEDLYAKENQPQDYRLEGFHWRKKTHCLKVAMLLSLAESDSLTIEVRDIKAAVQILQDLEPTMARAFSAVGKFEHASTIERIGNQVRLSGGMPLEQLYSRNYFAGDDFQLERLLNVLTKGGMVERKLIGQKWWLMPTAAVPPWVQRPKALEERLAEVVQAPAGSALGNGVPAVRKDYTSPGPEEDSYIPPPPGPSNRRPPVQSQPDGSGPQAPHKAGKDGP